MNEFEPGALHSKDDVRIEEALNNKAKELGMVKWHCAWCQTIKIVGNEDKGWTPVCMDCERPVSRW